MRYCQIYLLSFFLIISIFLSGCCSSGGSSPVSPLPPSPKEMELDTITVGNGAVNYYSNEGIHLTAIPGTFAEGTKIKFTKITGNNLLTHFGMEGKDLTLNSPVYGVYFEPNPLILENAATISIELDPTIPANDRLYFAVNRIEPTLVASNKSSAPGSNIRAAASNKLELGFFTTFNKIALVTVKKNELKEDPEFLLDSSVKYLSKGLYSSNINISTKLTPVDKNIFASKKGSLRMVLRIAEKWHKSGLNAFTKSDDLESKIVDLKTKSGITFGSIILSSLLPTITDSDIHNFKSVIKSQNLLHTEVPRRLILESVFTGSNNIPVSSPEKIVYFAPQKRPYIISTSPLNGSNYTDIVQINRIKINFSEPMKESSVNDAITIKVNDSTYNASDENLKFTWLTSKSLEITHSMNFNISKTASITVTVSDKAQSLTDQYLGKDSYSEKPSEYKFSYEFNRHKMPNGSDSDSNKGFFVVLDSPLPGSVDIDTGDKTSRKGPVIILKFSELFDIECITDKSLIRFTDGIKDIEYKSEIDTENFLFYIKPQSLLEYNTEYSVIVSGTISNMNKKHLLTLERDYKASFTTKSIFEGEGTLDSPFLIYDQEQLYAINSANYLNKDFYFRLENNIIFEDYSITPIGNDTIPFKGHFDGNNKTISQLNISKSSYDNIALFSNIADSEIKNLVMKDSNFSGNSYCAAIAGQSKNSVVSNILLTDSSLSGVANSGGIVGEAQSTIITDCKIRNTDFDYSSFNIGAIAGSVTDSRIENSSIELDDKTMLNGSENVGGISGLSNNSILINNEFSGKLLASDNNVGGIVGKAIKTKISKGKNLSKQMLNGAKNIGGIAGLVENSCIIENSASSCQINSTSGNAGGIAGKITDSYITDCYSSKEVSTTANTVGGIAGEIQNTTIKSCYSSATIKGTDIIGGIIGKGDDSSELFKVIALNDVIQSSSESKANTHPLIGLENASSLKSDCYFVTNIIFKNNGKSEQFKPEHHHGIAIDINKVTSEFFTKTLLFNKTFWNTSSKYPTLH